MDKCKEPGCKAVRAQGRVRCERHLAKKREYMRRYTEANKEKVNALRRAARAADPDKYAGHVRKVFYGVDQIEYEQMLEEQGRVCAACRQPETYVRNGKTLRLSVDHCHETGLVRGLLCGRCNRALGLVKDNKMALAGLVVYLSKAEGVKA